MSTHARYPSLQDRSVLITGGATGIGATLVEAFVAQGARVGFVDIDKAVRQGAGRAATGRAPRAGLRRRRPDRHRRARGRDRRAAPRIGPITVLLNNAANDSATRSRTRPSESWDAGVAVNLKHQFFAAQAVAPT